MFKNKQKPTSNAEKDKSTQPQDQRSTQAVQTCRHKSLRNGKQRDGVGVNKAALMQQEPWQPALHKAQSIFKWRQVFSLAPQGVLHHTSAQLSSHRTTCQCWSELSACSFQLHQLSFSADTHVLMTHVQTSLSLFTTSMSTRSQVPAFVLSKSTCGNQEDSPGKTAVLRVR